MEDLQTQIKNLIDKLPAEVAERSSLLERLEKEGPSVDLLSEVQAVLVEAMENLEEKYPEVTQELDRVNDELVQKVEQAGQELDRELENVEKDEKKVLQAAQEAMDQDKLSETRKSMGSN